MAGVSPPEGNGHQAEFSCDNQYVLAADEDFDPYRAGESSCFPGDKAAKAFDAG